MMSYIADNHAGILNALIDIKDHLTSPLGRIDGVAKAAVQSLLSLRNSSAIARDVCWWMIDLISDLSSPIVPPFVGCLTQTVRSTERPATIQPREGMEIEITSEGYSLTKAGNIQNSRKFGGIFSRKSGWARPCSSGKHYRASWPRQRLSFEEK